VNRRRRRELDLDDVRIGIDVGQNRGRDVLDDLIVTTADRDEHAEARSVEDRDGHR
jgi:hypothetical protein